MKYNHEVAIAIMSSSIIAHLTPLQSRAAIAQLTSTSSKYQNLINIAKCAGWAKKEGASMLFLPECLGFIGQSSDDTLKNAEFFCLDPESSGSQLQQIYDNDANDQSYHHSLENTILRCSSLDNDLSTGCHVHDLNEREIANTDVSILNGLRTIAIKSGLWISAGGIHEACDPTKQRVYNSHIILDSLGEIVAHYRKIHLFDVCIPSKKISLLESATTAPGTKLVVCDSPIGRLGLSTCYDIRFGEMYRELVEKGGADVLLAPSAFTVPTGKSHWHILLRARAIENQCYVLAAAQYGKHNQKRESYGHSIAIDPWGEVLTDAGGFDGPGTRDSFGESGGILSPAIILCNIETDKINTVRERIPIKEHRRKSNFSF
mmetsp:Transcript_5797/g.8414  ORF Transcript_5797/g.8414 Transcript_5797/m.8414 type:complete len:375 (-) Transcript_5797:548-1672(-)